jgi:hypothetical protein
MIRLPLISIASAGLVCGLLALAPRTATAEEPKKAPPDPGNPDGIVAIRLNDLKSSDDEVRLAAAMAFNDQAKLRTKEALPSILHEMGRSWLLDLKQAKLPRRR